MALYAFLRNDTRSEVLHAYKCTGDPTSAGNWSSVASYCFDGPIYDVCAFVQGGDVHLAVSCEKTLHGIASPLLSGHNRREVWYLRFDPGTDTFDITAESAGFEGRGSTTSIAVRSDGDVIVAVSRQAAKTTSSTADVTYSRREGGSWTRSVVVSSSTLADTPLVMGMGSSDRAVFAYRTATAVFSKTLTSANSLGTAVQIVGSADSAVVPVISYTYSATDYWLIHCAPGGTAGNVYRSTQADTPSWSASTGSITEPNIDTNVGARANMVLDGNNNPFVFLVANSDNDIDSHTAETGPDSWGSATSEVASITALNISVEAYDRSGYKVGVLYDNSGTLAFYEKDVSTGTAYTLACDGGTYAVTGTAVALKAARTLSIAAGSYSLSGTDAGLAKGRVLSCEAGAYAITGQAAGLLVGRTLSIGAGSYSLSGSDVGIEYGRVFHTDGGSYTVSGTTVGLLVGHVLQAASGAYAVTGTSAGLRAARFIHSDILLSAVDPIAFGDTETHFYNLNTAQVQSYVPSNTIDLTRVRIRLKRVGAITGGVVTVRVYSSDGSSPSKPTGSPIYVSITQPTTDSIGTSFADYEFLFSPGATLTASTEYFIGVTVTGHTGSDVNNYIASFRNVGGGSNVNPGHIATFNIVWIATAANNSTFYFFGEPGNDYSVNGQDVTLAKGRTLAVDSGVYQVTGTTVGLLTTRLLTVGQGAYTVTGQTASLLADRTITAESAGYQATPATIGLLKGYVFPTAAGTYVVTGTAAGLLRTALLTAAAGAYTISGQDVTLTYTPVTNYSITADPGSYTVAGTDASLERGAAVLTGAGSYSISGSSVGLLTTRTVLIGAGSYAVTGTDALLNRGRTVLASGGSYVVTGTDATLARTRALVAGAGAYVLSGTPAALKTGRRITIDPGAIAVIPPEDDKVWGKTDTGTASSGVNECRTMEGITPNLDGMVLESVSIYNAFGYSSPIRLAVYQGGSSGDPTGASLVEDLGQTPSSGPDGWVTVASTTRPALAGNTRTWVVYKGDAGTSFRKRFGPVTGDYIQEYRATGFDIDDAVAFPSTFPAGGATNTTYYALYLDYSLQPVTLLATRTVSAAAGVYTITGQDVLLRRGQAVIAGTGSYTTSGGAAVLKAARTIPIGAGSYVVTGQSVSLIKVGDYALLVDGGIYSVTGTAVQLLRAARLTASAGAYSVAGQATNLLRGYAISAEAGAYSVTGQAVGLPRTYVLMAGAGAVSVAGTAIRLPRTYIFPAGTGAYTVSGQTASLLATRRLNTWIDAYFGGVTSWTTLWSHAVEQSGQSLLGNGESLGQVIFPIRRGGSPPGVVVVKLYAHTGTYGSGGLPTGTAIATSEPVDPSDLDTFFSVRPFRFASPPILSAGTPYFLMVEYADGDSGNYVEVGYDNTAPTHPGNRATGSDQSWTAGGFSDTPFDARGPGSLVTVAGSDVALLYGRAVLVGSGTYTVSGLPTTLLATRLIAAQAGAYVVTGQSALLIKVGDYGILAESGSYAVSGTSAALKKAAVLSAAAGSITVTGTPVGTLRGAAVLASAGAYVVTGSSVTLSVSANPSITAEAGSYAVSGQTAGLLAGRLISVAAGAVTVNGQAATLVRGRALLAESGAFTTNGQPASLLATRLIGASPGAYVVSGSSLQLRRGYLMTVDGGAYNVTGSTASLIRGRRIVMGAGAYAVTGAAVTLTWSGFEDVYADIEYGEFTSELGPSITSVELAPSETRGRDDLGDFVLRENDTRPILKHPLKNPDGTVYDATGNTGVKLHIYFEDAAPPFSRDMVVTSTDVQYTWVSSDWTAPDKLHRGRHRMVYEVHGPGDFRLTFPNKSHDVLIIEGDIGQA